MSVGGFVFGAVVFLFLTILGSVWLYRCLRDGAVGMGGDLTPAIRRVRQPVKFWIAVLAVALTVAMPLALFISLFLALINS